MNVNDASTPKPISEVEIWDLISTAEGRMTRYQRRFYDLIRIDPEKWSEAAYGHLTEGFWVVGVLGRTVIWYNEIEDGFNVSRYTIFGSIDEYFCNQDELAHAVQQILDNLNLDLIVSYRRLGPPEALSSNDAG